MLASLNDSGIDLVLPKDCVVRLNITNKWKWCLKKRREAHEWNTKVKLRISFHFHFLTNGLIKIDTGAIVLKYWLFCRTVGHLLGGCCHHHIHTHVALQLPCLLQVLHHRCLCIEKMTKKSFVEHRVSVIFTSFLLLSVPQKVSNRAHCLESLPLTQRVKTNPEPERLGRGMLRLVSFRPPCHPC